MFFLIKRTFLCSCG